MFPGGHPSKYWLGSMLLNFSDRTRTGVFNMIWPLARVQEIVNILFQQHTYLLTDMRYLNSVYKFAHRLGWNVVGLNMNHFCNYPRASWAFPAVSNSCFEHFYARIIAKTRLRFAFSSLRIQINFLKAWYSAGLETCKLSFLPLINTIPTSADTLKFLYSNYFLLILMYLLRQYIY